MTAPVTTWILDAPPDWSAPHGLTLVGSEKHAGGWADVDGLSLAEVVRRFGVSDSARAALSWRWQIELEAIPSDLFEGIFLVDTESGAKVPMASAPRLMGQAVTPAGLAALGFLDDSRSEAPASPAVPSLLIDVDEAARLLSLSPVAPRKRVERHQIPGVVRTGKRIQFSREKLTTWISKKARP